MHVTIMILQGNFHFFHEVHKTFLIYHTHFTPRQPPLCSVTKIKTQLHKAKF
jgi:hypothetical protein